jgi:hypothetical protein
MVDPKLQNALLQRVAKHHGPIAGRLPVHLSETHCRSTEDDQQNYWELGKQS